MVRTLAEHERVPYPHQGGCEACRDTRVCNYCGGSLNPLRCTNGRCGNCHTDICTAGGSTERGHGFGQQGEPWQERVA